MEVLLVQFVKPFVLLVVLGITWPVARVIERRVQRMRDGRLKRFLMLRW